MWGEDIEALSEKRLLACLRNAKRQMKTGHPDYQWPNIGLILGYVDSSWESAAQRNDFTGCAQLEDLTGKEKRIEERKAQLKKLREQTGL